MDGISKSERKLAHATPETAPAVPGRRDFISYRDLGVADASGGAMRATLMNAREGMSRPTGWHYHVCEAQFVYMLKGWVDLEFEDGTTRHVRAGESIFIPGGMRHNEIKTSDGFELLEVTVPGDMGTEPCEAPEGFQAKA